MEAIRIYERFQNEVNKPYYGDELPDSVCLERALNILNYIEEKNIDLDNLVKFRMLGNTCQMAMSCDELDLAQKLLLEAQEYCETEWNIVTLMWRESKLKFQQNRKEESLNCYITTIDEYERLHKEYPDFQPSITKQNICATKLDFIKFFNDKRYVIEALELLIELHLDGVESSEYLMTTYREIKGLVSDDIFLNAKIERMIKKAICQK